MYSSTAVVPFFSSTHVSEGARPTQGLIIVSRVRTTAVPGTAVAPFFSSTHVSEGARPTQGLIIVSRVRARAWLDCSTWDKLLCKRLGTASL